MTDPDVLRDRPWWQWRHGGSRAPRPAHLAMDRKVFPAGSFPMPPWGFGCQCTVFSLSQRDLDREGLTPEPEWQPWTKGDYTDPATGQTTKVALKPDPGFEYSPGKSTAVRRQEVLEQALRRLNPELAGQVRREVELARENATVMIRDDRLEERRRTVVDLVGEEVARQAEENFARAMQEAKVFIDISPENLAKFIEDGVYKSTFAVPAGQNEFRYIEQRRQAEVKQFGYPEAIPQENRPAYGYWSRSVDSPEVAFKQSFPEMYGSVTIELREGVRGRSSFAMDDSMIPPKGIRFGGESAWQVSRVDRPNAGSFLVSVGDDPDGAERFVRSLASARGLDDIAAAKAEFLSQSNNNSYIEAQIHGGLIPLDVAKIVVSKGASIPDSVEAWARSNGVEVDYVE